MFILYRLRRSRFPALARLVALAAWQVALAEAPLPNPLPNVNGVNPLANGAAASIHGNPFPGRAIFAAICATCHEERGTLGADNPGSDDSLVPTLNPIDPGFLETSKGDQAKFAGALDLFIQHGSRPPNPARVVFQYTNYAGNGVTASSVSTQASPEN